MQRRTRWAWPIRELLRVVLKSPQPVLHDCGFSYREMERESGLSDRRRSYCRTELLPYKTS